MDDIRLRRLQADYESMRYLVRVNPKVQVESVSGSPPTLYRLTLNVRSLREQAGSLTYVDTHRVEIRLPLGYPRNAPVCRMLTPVFHPNIAPHAICIGDDWSAGEALDALVMRICEMLAFQSYNVKSPLNGEAAQWVEEHLSELPLDSSFFFVEKDLDFEVVDTDNGQQEKCANCGEPLGEGAERCEAGHYLCENCVIHCETCSRLLCLACGETVCPTCHPELAAAIKQGQKCANCGEPLGEDAEQCEAGHYLCADCVIHCETCSRLLCLVCGETVCSVCQPEASG
jgi:ubiquitin-protein ligase